MRFSTTAGALRDAVATARHAVPANASLVAYSGVLLLVKGAQLAIFGSDGETTISALVAVADSSDGQVLLPPRPLTNYLNTLDPSAAISVRADEGADVEVQAGTHAPYRFRPVAATFPQPSMPRTAPVPVQLGRLGLALSAVRASVSKENPGVQLVSSVEDGLVLHSTDNYRLSRSEISEGGFGEFSGLVPLGVLDRVARSEINQVSVDTKGRTLRFSGPEISISARLLSTPFPSVESVLTSTPPSSASFPAADLRQALAALASIAESEPLRCSVDQDRLTLSISNADLGSGEEVVDLNEPVTTPFEFAVKLNYLLEAVNSHDASVLTLGWSSAVAPLFVSSRDPLPVISVVMPVRL